jgi:hypothetical protein
MQRSFSVLHKAQRLHKVNFLPLDYTPLFKHTKTNSVLTFQKLKVRVLLVGLLVGLQRSAQSLFQGLTSSPMK